MITHVTIANYKSVEQADFEARRVNVFIGEPNSGKSNLLEAIAVPSKETRDKLVELFRIQQAADLFFDREIEREISVKLGSEASWFLKFQQGSFVGNAEVRGKGGQMAFDVNGHFQGGSVLESLIRFYRYLSLRKGQWNANRTE